MSERANADETTGTYGVAFDPIWSVEATSNEEARRKAVDKLIETVKENDREDLLEDAGHLFTVVDYAEYSARVDTNGN